MGRHKRDLAEICVKAVLAVADLKRKDVNLELIKARPLTRAAGAHSAVSCPGARRRLCTAECFPAWGA